MNKNTLVFSNSVNVLSEKSDYVTLTEDQLDNFIYHKQPTFVELHTSDGCVSQVNLIDYIDLFINDSDFYVGLGYESNPSSCCLLNITKPIKTAVEKTVRNKL